MSKLAYRLTKNPHPALSQRERGKASQQKIITIGVRDVL
jgi:hypothetical protein